MITMQTDFTKTANHKNLTHPINPIKISLETTKWLPWKYVAMETGLFNSTGAG